MSRFSQSASSHAAIDDRSSYGAIVEIRGGAGIPGFPVGRDLHELEPPGNNQRMAGSALPSVPYGALQMEQHPERVALVGLVHQYRALCEHIAVALEDEIDGRVKQRMTGAETDRRWPPGDLRLLEADAFVTFEYRFDATDPQIASPERAGHAGYLVASDFAPVDGSAQVPERPEEEALDVMRLQAAGFRALHLFADVAHLGRAQVVAHERPVFQQGQEAIAIDRTVHALEETGLDLRPFAVANGVHEQVAHLGPLEEAPEYVVDPSAEGLAGGLQLLEQPAVDLPFAGVLRDEIPEMADLGLADAMDAPEPLFQPVRIPRQIVVDHQMGALEVDAFAGRVVRHHRHNARIMHERFDGLAPVLPSDPAVDHDHRLGPAEASPDLPGKVLQRVAGFGEDDELAPIAAGIGHQGMIEDARELEPFCVRAIAPQLPRPDFEALQRAELGFELGDGLRRRGVVQHSRLGSLDVLLGRIFKIVEVDVGYGYGIGDHDFASRVVYIPLGLGEPALQPLASSS